MKHSLSKSAKHDDFLAEDALRAAMTHVDEAVSSHNIALGTAECIIYSLIEVLGSMIGDPNLPSHIRSGYEGLLDTARELQTKLHEQKNK